MTGLKKLIVLAVLFSSPAAAQQAPDPAFVQKVVEVLQQQRNAAMDLQAQALSQVAVLNEEITKLKARIAELEKPPASTEKKP